MKLTLTVTFRENSGFFFCFVTNIYSEGLMHLLGERREFLHNQIPPEDVPDNNE